MRLSSKVALGQMLGNGLTIPSHCWRQRQLLVRGVGAEQALSHHVNPPPWHNNLKIPKKNIHDDQV